MTGRTPPTVLPSVPVDLVAVAIGGCQVILAWTECEVGAFEFRIERADGIGSACRFSEVGCTGAHVAAFRDGTVKPGTTYSYRVHASHSSGHSPPSDVVEVTTPQIGTEHPDDKD
jgi:hypothetical protein